VKWTDYSTCTAYLDSIDQINNRDYGVSLNDKNQDLKQLSIEGLKIMDKYYNEEIAEAELIQKQEQFFNDGVGRKILAKQLLELIKYVPIDVPKLTINEIPDYLNKLMKEIGEKLEIYDSHEINNQRSASVIFGIALCELFRTPGSMKHFRQCLQIVRDCGYSFSKVFGNSFKDTICFLSPKGGTKKTRDILQKGLLLDLTDLQKKGWDFSDSSDDELEVDQKKIIIKQEYVTKIGNISVEKEVKIPSVKFSPERTERVLQKPSFIKIKLHEKQL